MTALTLAAAVLLVLTWVGYPLVVQGIGRLVARPRPGLPDHWPAVTVVVATRESAEVIRDRVDDLLRSAYPDEALKVVVALDASSPVAEADCVVPDARVQVLRGDAPGGKAAALNAGVRAADGDVLVFTDSHQRFDPHAIAALVTALRDPDFGAVSGQLELPEGRNRTLLEHYWRFERRLRRHEAEIHSAIGVSGSIYAMRRALWSPLPDGLILDDLYVPMRLVLGGHRVGFTPAARALDSRRTDVGQEFQRKVRTLTGNFQLCAWLPGVLLPWRNPVWLQFIMHKLLRLLTPWLALLVALGTLAMAIRAWGWVVLPALVIGAGVAVLAAQFLGVRRRLWAYTKWLLVMQGALAVASFNGITGRWNVWSRQR